MVRKRKDPQYAEEAARYARPIASRELILARLDAHGVPMSEEDLACDLGIENAEDRNSLKRRLKAMARDGQVIDNRRGAWGLVSRMDLVRGTVQANREGFGFLVPEDGTGDLYLHARQMRKVFDGDEVLASVAGVDRRGRPEAKIIEVLHRNTHFVVGRYRSDAGLARVVSENPRIQHDVLLPPGTAGTARDGQYVTVEIVDQPTASTAPTGKIVEVLGDHLAPGMEIEVALRSHGIPFRWPDDAQEQAGKLPDAPLAKDFAGRFDLRDKPFVTIDGEDAKDFDDAVYCEAARGGGFMLWVAIADVSHYVRSGSSLDREAAERGNSVYFPGRVVPMLPEALSNGLCSLKPRVNRLALVCQMRVSAAGRLTRYQFCEAVIKSRARLTYTRVAGFLDDPKAIADMHIDRALARPLSDLKSLYQGLRAARETRGAIDFETTETQIVFGPQRKIERVEPLRRNDAHRLIEECMLLANVAAAKFLEKHKLAAPYRVHDGPSAEKLTALRAFLAELGLGLGGGRKPTPLDYQRLLAQITGRPDAHVIQTVLLRSLSQARYQLQNIGHFGLNYPGYTHFTSPIRRYCDLLIHRAIRSVIGSSLKSPHVLRIGSNKRRSSKQAWPYQKEQIANLAEHCSMTERRADDAVREVVSWLKCEYLQDRLGEEFDAVVSGVTAFGLFVELKDIFADGLVHVSSLENDYYHFDPLRHRLVGERFRKVYRLGDPVRVQLVQVNLDERKIDLQLIGSSVSRRRRRSR